jgi:glycosyltransferase involved in cell wall biosynthesis
MNKYFTIVIPTLNEEKHLPNLLNDLSKQSFSDFQVIVVDANSKDKTRSIAKGYKVRVVISDEKNVSYQRNLGAKNSKTDWVVFMDADNRIPKNYLAGLKHHAEKLNPDILSTWLKPDTNLSQDKITATIMNIYMDINKNSKEPYVMESMILVKRSSFEKLGGFDININWREGENLLKRALAQEMTFEFLKTPKFTYSFRRFKKIGAFKMFQEMSQMEIIKMLKGGKLTRKETAMLYPMKGGSFYKDGKRPKLTLRKFLSILFQDNKISKKSVNLFEKSLDSWKSFFS